MESVEAVVIGAGVIGLACARALARAGKETIIIERHSRFGSETSARNSEVIHAGIYYPKNSLKAKLCVRGRELLYEFCRNYNIPHKNCGKLIVATTAQQENSIVDIMERAKKNNVADLQYLSASEIQKLEPALNCRSALLSPSTGILSSHDYMLALLGDAQNDGASVAFNTDFLSAAIKGDYIEVSAGKQQTTKLQTKILINAAGLSAPNAAHQIEGLGLEFIPQCYFAKGSYYSLSSKAPFTHLIYPVPVAGGLGVHLTLDLAGQARFGPDVEWVRDINYDVDPARAESFYAAIRTYWPDLKDHALQPAYSGIRPKIVGPGEKDADFLIQGPDMHGIPGLINLFGIESPGLTSSLAIAEHVLEKLNISSNN